MSDLGYKAEGGVLILQVKGHVDSANAPVLEEEINKVREAQPAESIVIDCADLEYISSAGLRIILRLKKACPDVKIINVSGDVYEILETTGFTEMMEVHKASRQISVEGCEVIGQGANGKVYRIDRDTIVKVYLDPNSLDDINRERELARTAFVLGVPTAIPFDVVKVEGGGYGSVFELLDAKSLAKLLQAGEKTVDEVAQISIDLLKIIHSTEVKPGSVPDMKQTALGWADFLKDYLEPQYYEKLHALVEAVPEDFHMMHGDYHLKNVMVQNGEALLIDMDTLCYGHPVFELASMFNAYSGFSELDPSVIKAFLGIEREQGLQIWDKSLKLYLGTEDAERIKEVAEKAQIIGYTRLMRRRIRRNGLNEEEGKREIACYKKHLEDLIPRTETLVF